MPLPMRLAARTARWLRIIARREEKSVAAVIRELRTPAALAVEVVRVLDILARDEAAALLNDKKHLPADADWLTRHHYMAIKQTRDAAKAIEQDAAWAEYVGMQS